MSIEINSMCPGMICLHDVRLAKQDEDIEVYRDMFRRFSTPREQDARMNRIGPDKVPIVAPVEGNRRNEAFSD